MIKGAFFLRLSQRKSLAPPCVRQIDAFEHEGQFRETERAGDNAAIGLNRNPERPCFQAFVVQAIPAAVPEQDFYPVTIAVEEYEQMAGQWVLADNA